MMEAPVLAAPAGTDSWSAEIGSIRVHMGPGSIEQLGGLARELGASRVLVVTDPGVRAAGYAEHAVRVLNGEGIAASVFDQVSENPTTTDVEAGRSFAAERGIDLLVGLGGGSAMDCAKGINFLLTNGGRMEDYLGFGKASQPLLPSIGVPTTAGTGSEAQSYALISQAETHRKMACGDRKARFRDVILDPDLTATAPRRVRAAAGIDAVSHAVESFVCTRANPVSRMFAREAWRLLDKSFDVVSRDPGCLGDMLLGSHLAGAAIEGSMLGAAHACANPLTARFGVVHGVAVGLMLPHVVRFNGEVYRELSGLSSEVLARRIEELRIAAGLPTRVCEVVGNDLDRQALRELAEDAAGQWTARFNPRPVDAEDLYRLYEVAL
jgi:alcohol dehydrogenase